MILMNFYAGWMDLVADGQELLQQLKKIFDKTIRTPVGYAGNYKYSNLIIIYTVLIRY